MTIALSIIALLLVVAVAANASAPNDPRSM